MAPTVLFLGATGYVGGSVLTSLKKSYPDVTFTSLVRSASSTFPQFIDVALKQANIDVKSNTVTRSTSQFDRIRAAGGEPVVGSLDDYELITKLSSEADIIINAADSDTVELLDALLAGQRKRRAEGRGVGSFVHTSGCNIFNDNSNKGKFDPNGKVWTDSEENVRSFTTSMSHGQVDVPLMQASEAGDVHSFIISPSGVYGTGSGPDKRDSLFVRMFASHYVQRRKAFYINEGSNRYCLASSCISVHIDDLVDLFGLVFKLALDALTTPPSTNPYERYYIANTTPIVCKDLIGYFARVLYKNGRVDSPEPSSLSFEEAGPFGFMVGSNVLPNGFRALELGWKPKYIALSEEALVEQVEVASKYVP